MVRDQAVRVGNWCEVTECYILQKGSVKTGEGVGTLSVEESRSGLRMES